MRAAGEPLRVNCLCRKLGEDAGNCKEVGMV